MKAEDIYNWIIRNNLLDVIKNEKTTAEEMSLEEIITRGLSYLANSENASGASVYPILAVLKDRFRDRNINVGEIGVRHGHSTFYIICTLNVENYYAIDPFLSYDDYSGDGFNDAIKDMGGDNLLINYLNQINIARKLRKTNIHIIRDFSNKAHTNIENESLDFCFIDGNHTYDYVMDDLVNYFPKIAPGGIIAGDDYFMRHIDNDVYKTGAGCEEKMVYEAVDEFVTNRNLSLETYGDHRGYPSTWLIRKD